MSNSISYLYFQPGTDTFDIEHSIKNIEQLLQQLINQQSQTNSEELLDASRFLSFISNKVNTINNTNQIFEYLPTSHFFILDISAETIKCSESYFDFFERPVTQPLTIETLFPWLPSSQQNKITNEIHQCLTQKKPLTIRLKHQIQKTWYISELLGEILDDSLHMVWRSGKVSLELNRLIDSHKRYRLLIENAPICIHEIDLDGRLISMNAAGLKMMGVSEETDIIGMPYLDAVCQQDRQVINDFLNQAKVGKELFFEFKAATQDIRYFSSSFVPIKSENGEIIRLMGMTMDITKERVTRLSLKESELNYKALSESTFEALIIHVDQGEQIIEYNPVFARMFGYSLEEVQAIHPSQFSTPETAQLVKHHIINQLETPYEGVGVKKDGTQFPIEIVGKNGMFRGKPARITGIRDISARKRVEVELKESQERTRAFAEASFNGVILLINGQIKECNQQFATIFAYPSPDEVIGLYFDDIIQDKNQAQIILDSILKGFEQTIKVEGIRRDKTPCPLEVQARNIFYKGHLAQAINVRDLSYQYKIESQKQALKKQVYHFQKLDTMSSLAGGMVHDFNTLLMLISIYSERNFEYIQSLNQDALMDNTKKIIGVVYQAKEVVEQIMMFNKQVAKEKKPIDLKELIASTVNLLKPSIPDFIQSNFVIEGDSQFILGDRSLLHQVLINLCSNAWQSMAKQGFGELSIHLSTVQDSLPSQLKADEHFCLSITDTGCGMTAEQQKMIFEPFYTTKGENEGTGLGLSIVKSIIEDHEGSIVVESTVAQGTTFKIFFPILSLETPSHETQQIQSQSVNDSRIMIIDDEPSIVDFLTNALSIFGYEIIAFKDGQKALDYVKSQSNKVDLIISDFAMGNYSGFQLAQELQVNNLPIPVIIFSGTANMLDETIKNHSLIKRMVNKPIQFKNLLEVIEQVLEENNRQS